MSGRGIFQVCLCLVAPILMGCTSHVSGGGTSQESQNLLARTPQTFLLTQRHIQRTLGQSFQIDLDALSYQEPSLQIYQTNHLASVHTLSDVPGYFSMTENLVDEHFAKFLACAPSALDEACLRETVETVGKKLFRRNLKLDEVNRYMQLATSGGPEFFELGARYALVALLNSPAFLYQTFYGQDGRLTSMELASRLAFFLRGANPDEELIEASMSAEFLDSGELETQANRLLGDKASTGEFFADVLLEAWALNHLSESPTAEYYSEELTLLEPHLLREFQSTAQRVYETQAGDWRRIFDYDRTMVNRTLAQHYGFSTVPMDDATWEEVTLDTQRSGLLASGLVMAAHSGNKYTSTTHRGLFIVNDLLCQSIAAVPGGVQNLIEETGLVLSDEDTVTERIDMINLEPACARCHAKFDPQGRTFENFDNFGRFFEVRYEAPVESEAVVLGQSVSNPRELAQAVLKDEDNLAKCFFKKLYTYGLGSLAEDGNSDLLEGHGISGETRFQFDELVKAMIMHEKFAQVRLE